MLIEAATALLLVFRRPEDIPLAAALVGLAIVGVVWLSDRAVAGTAPLHARPRFCLCVSLRVRPCP